MLLNDRLQPRKCCISTFEIGILLFLILYASNPFDDESVDENCKVVRVSAFRSCFLPPEQDKKDRRAIANNNERRRMQSINAGFHSLRNAIRPHSGDKLSKVIC